LPCLSFLMLLAVSAAMNDLPQFFGPERHLNVRYTQRICHSGSHCRSRANRTRFTNSFHTQWVD